VPGPGHMLGGGFPNRPQWIHPPQYGAPIRLTETVVSDFDGSDLAVEWTDGYGTVSETGGVCLVTTDTGFSAAQTLGVLTLQGSYVFVKIVPPAALGAVTESAAELLVTSTTAGTDAGFNINTVTGLLTCMRRVGYAGTYQTFTYDPTAHAWVRLRESGGFLFWDVSPDGFNWTQIYTEASPSWVSDATLRIALTSHKDSGTSTVATFDNVNVPGVSATNAPAGLAAATATADNPSPAVATLAELAAATAAANDPIPAAGALAENAAASAAANNPSTASTVDAGLAAGTAAADNPTPAVFVFAECATATATAYDATVTTVTSTSAPAELAAATATADNAVASVGVLPGSSAGTATADNAGAAVFALAGCATATAAADNATASTVGAFSVVQDWVFADTGTATSPTNVTVNLGVAATAGTTLLAAVNSDATVSTPSGWTLIASSIHNAGCYLFAKLAAGGETGITVTPDVAAATCVGIVELTGMSGANIAAQTDVTATNGSAAGSTTRSTGTTATSTSADEYAVALWGYSASQGIYPAGGANKWSGQTNSFTEKGDQGTTKSTGTNVGLCVAVRVLTSTVTVESTAGTGSDAPPSESLVATFRILASSDLTPAAGNAPATGSAGDVTAALTVNAEHAAAAATANNPSTAAATLAGDAAATATANAPTVSVGVLPTTAAATAAADNPTPAPAALPTSAAATAAADNPTADVQVFAGCAEATATAHDATISTAALVNAPAELAAATATASDPTTAVGAFAESAAATGTANAPTPAVSVLPGSAAGTATANNAGANVQALAGCGTASAAALDSSAAIAVLAEAALIVAEAYGVTQSVPVFPADSDEAVIERRTSAAPVIERRTSGPAVTGKSDTAAVTARRTDLVAVSATRASTDTVGG
jgi:hypothetical protein